MIGIDLIEGCAAKKTAVVVLDTTCFAGPAVGSLLQTLGCDSPASDGEDVNKIAGFNNAVLQSAGLSATDWVPFNRLWLASPKASEFLNEAIELLQTEFGGSYISLIQDGCTARILPFWNIVFDRAGVLPRYLLTVDDPVRSVKHIHDTLGVEESIGQLIWLRVALDAELHSRGCLRAFAAIGQLGTDPITTLNSIARAVNLTFPRDAQAVLESAEFGSNLLDLRGKGQANKVWAVADWVAATHQVFVDWAANGETAEGLTVLDAIREAFDEAVPAFSKLGRSLEALTSKVHELEQELEALRAKRFNQP
jgi:hypothetical protein